MNDIQFLKNFCFNEFLYRSRQHNDNSHGVDRHFLGYLKQGSALLIEGKKQLELHCGDFFYIPKGCRYHSYWNTDGETVQLDSIGFSYFPSRSVNGYLLQKIEYTEERREAFSPLSLDKTVNAASIGCLYRLLGMLEQVLQPAPAQRAEAVVECLIEWMQRDHEKTVGEYASACAVSEAQLYLYTKSVLQKTPNQLRREIVCQKAVTLLCDTDRSVEEICTALGFSSASYFRKTLREVTGKTPTQIRRKARLI